MMNDEEIQRALNESLRRIDRIKSDLAMAESATLRELCTTAEFDALRAKNEKAEARAEHEHAEMQRQAKLAVDWMLDAKRAEAACAEMRAAGDRLHDDLVLYHPRADVLAEWNTLRTRTDLGRGWASPEVVRRCRTVIVEFSAEYPRLGLTTLLADLDALLKKGGG